MRALARRTASGFIPADSDAETEFRRVPVGKVAYFEITTARNPKQHRLLFALLKMLVNADCFPTTDAALFAVKVAVGHVDRVVFSKDEVHLKPKSISFANLKQSEFDVFFDAALREVSVRWLPGVPEELRREIEEMLNGTS